MGIQHPEWGPEPPVAPYGPENLPAEHVVIPLVFPVLGKPRWGNSYNENRGAFRHTGIDILAPKMTPIVAPFGGVLGMKKESFWIYNDNGWITLGTHLNDDNLGTHDHRGSRDLMFAPNLVPGQRVYAGQFIGYVGESGDATAPHLHFEIYAPGPGPTMGRVRNPYSSLKAAKILSAPVVIPPAEHPAANEIRFDGCVRKVDLSRRLITLILVDKELPSGETFATARVRYLRVELPNALVNSCGGWGTFASLPPSTLVGVFLANTPKVDDAVARRIVIAKSDR